MRITDKRKPIHLANLPGIRYSRPRGAPAVLPEYLATPMFSDAVSRNSLHRLRLWTNRYGEFGIAENTL